MGVPSARVQCAIRAGRIWMAVEWGWSMSERAVRMPTARGDNRAHVRNRQEF